MTHKRIAIIAIGVVTLVALVATLSVRTGLFRAQSDAAQAQGLVESNMEQRLTQVIEVLNKDPGPEAVAAAIDEGMSLVTANMRILPSPDVDETEQIHARSSAAEMRFAEALAEFVEKGKSTEVKGRALDLKLALEELNEVAHAVGEITRQCGDGASLQEPPCDVLQPLLDEETGEELVVNVPPDQDAQGTLQQPRPTIIQPGFSVKLRGPFVPPWFTTPTWQDDVRVTEPIGDGECAVVFKETKGLMLRLHFRRIIIVSDPWVNVWNLPRGTRIPIWVLEWVPSEYVKEWTLCNQDGEIVRQRPIQQIKQDVPLNYFWRLYPKDP